MKVDYRSVDEYIQTFPKETQKKLLRIRKIIRDKAPGAVEGISYGMPAYKLKGKPLLYFGGFRNHIGFFATPSGHAAFAEELSGYKHGKGSVQFPLDKPVPYDLTGQIVEFRVQEILFKPEV